MSLSAAGGTYARSAISVSLQCFQKQTCSVALVRSPDGIKTVRRIFQREQTFRWDRDDIEFYVPDVELITASGHWNLSIPVDWNDFDVLWSPDSKFVALTGNMNGYMESVRVFQITESGPVNVDVAKMPFADMIRRFPPCRALHADPTVCGASHDDEDFNFAAIAWADTHTLVLMSEVPCTSLWGGIMCQVMGYKVNLPGGNIVETMLARDFQRKWQHEMAWRFRVPEPPEWQN